MSGPIDPAAVLHLLSVTHPMDRIPRAGYLLRGVTEPESVAAHSFSVALLAMLYAHAFPDLFNADKAVSIALIHDTSESETMDIPMPAGTDSFKKAKRQTEQLVIERIFESIDKRYSEYHQELLDGISPEARLIRALDKAQMMAKVSLYEREGRGRLDDFWSNSANFRDEGYPFIQELYVEIAEAAGRQVPRE